MVGLAGSRRYVVRHVQLDPIRGTGEFDRVGSPNPRAMASELDLRLVLEKLGLGRGQVFELATSVNQIGKTYGHPVA
jgi:hypothetical protein